MEGAGVEGYRPADWSPEETRQLDELVKQLGAYSSVEVVIAPGRTSSTWAGRGCRGRGFFKCAEWERSPCSLLRIHCLEVVGSPSVPSQVPLFSMCCVLSNVKC